MFDWFPDLLIQAGVLLVGLWLIFTALISAVRTFILPRSARDPLTRLVFQGVRFLFNLRLRFAHRYPTRDRIMALYAPVALITLLPAWYVCVTLGYAMIFWVAGIRDWQLAIQESGSSLLTLGFVPAQTFLHALIAFSEGTLVMVALLISYLPTMYSAFSRREIAVTLLEVRAGDPPSDVEMIKRYHRIHGLERLGEVWENWEIWFADLEESHTSLAALVFFRSPQPNHSWVTAAGTVLDAAALTLSTVDIPQDARANLCIRAGFLALRRIADFFEISYEPNPTPNSPISVCREQFDQVYEELAAHNVPLKANRDQAWRDFSGWRVNYDPVLLAIARITMAPPASWINDEA